MESKHRLLTGAIRQESKFHDLVAMLEMQRKMSHPLPSCITGLSEGAGDALLCTLIEEIKRLWGCGPLLILPDEHATRRLCDLFTALGFTATVYPFRDLLFQSIASSHDGEHQRLSVLSDIIRGRYDVILTTPDAALQYTVPRARLQGLFRTVSREDVCDLDALCSYLTSCGYTSADLVEGVGQFARRGGILDVFPPNSEYPIRMELFGDEIDQIGIFDIVSQRKIEDLDYVTLSPAREICPTEEDRAEILACIAQLKKGAKAEQKEKLLQEEELLRSGSFPLAIDKYLPLIYPEGECLLDYFPDGVPFLLSESAAVKKRLDSYFWHADQECEALLAQKQILPAHAHFGGDETDFISFIQSRCGFVLNTLLSSSMDLRWAGIYDFQTKQTVSYADNMELLVEDLTGYLSAGFKTVLLCPNEMMARNLLQSLKEDHGIRAVLASPGEPADAPLTITAATAFSGYELTMSRFALLSLYTHKAAAARITARRRAKKSAQSAKERVLSYADLNIGDYVVHASHGIGQYKGLETIEVDGATRDFIRIAYAGTDSLFLPATQLDSISKYIGARADDGSVKLSRLGGSDWQKTKTRVKAATKEMAKELIQLYASRARREGYAFAPDGEMQKEFDAAFRYEETEGQLQAIREIKADMESPRPMDRLLCGDVGFGKTEVAMRAAFKAVENGKQVAILVPTTILALQHYQTLTERLGGFPVKVEMLSRFRTPAQQSDILGAIRRGDVDIIVGTHRILSTDLAFRDLGLVIIDEEQRFGVGAKEKLKQITSGVDVLTLTATPIPRTLNMAMAGIRDMSVLEEAPGDRVPVQTYVLEYDTGVIAEAFRKELRRGGQIFYLYNKVESIESCAARVREMAGDDVRIAVAHGQMDKEALSDIWRGMIAGDYDILVSTTIIESGVDVPNANTLIIENADHFGLSQLHQIRGRVGRSLRRAYAYFTYPKGMVLSEVASKRLTALREYTEFGAGFKVAIRDLEIRGAGNLLGAQQHGHIESVGYELYMKLLDEAILEEKGQTVQKKTECAVDLGISAYIPESYIRPASQRIEAYKKISLIRTEEDMRDRLDELLDRYGDMPACVRDLVAIAYLRVFAAEAGILRIEKKGVVAKLVPVRMEYAVWQKVFEKHKGRLKVNFAAQPYIAFLTRGLPSPTDAILNLLKEYAEILRAGVDKR